MLRELKLPEGGMGITEGTILKWHKGEGDTVTMGELLVDVETAKAVAEVSAPVAGVLEKILLGPGQTAEVGTAIALLRQAD